MYVLHALTKKKITYQFSIKQLGDDILIKNLYQTIYM